MKRALVSLLALGLGFGPALAQVNTVPQTGLTTGYLAKNTYTAAFVGLTPASSATDLICISGSATKTIRLQRIRLSGTAATLITAPFTILRRASLDSGGTSPGTIANPANTIQSMDPSTYPVSAATATLVSYTANPTINDTSPTYIDSASITLTGTATSTVIVPATFDFGVYIEDLIAAPTLRGTAQQICVNLNSTSISTGLINGTIVWTEE